MSSPFVSHGKEKWAEWRPAPHEQGQNILSNFEAFYVKDSNAGFTLIELVIVIVVLGILAATAMPRFQDFSTEARQAVRDGGEGALKSGRAIEVAKRKGVDPTVAQLAAATDPKGTAFADGIELPKVFKNDGVTLHRFFTFKDAAGDCATATAATTDPVTCVKQ